MTTRYIDYNRGDDASADPTNPATPWKELTKIKTIVATAGDQFLLADDSEWTYDLDDRAITGVNWTGTQDNPVIIGKYSPSGTPSALRPTIRFGHEIAANEWTYSAPNNAWVWTSTFGNLHQLCLVLLGADRAWGASSMPDYSPLPLDSEDGHFLISGANLYMYAPAGTNPTDYYGGVWFSGLEGSALFHLGVNIRGITIQDLNFVETGSGVYLYSNVSGADAYVTIDRCGGEMVSQLFHCLLATNDKVTLAITNCTVNGWGSCAVWLYGGGSGYYMRSFTMTGNRFTDGNYLFAQGPLYCQCKFRWSDIAYNYVSHARYGSGGGNIYDGCGIYIEAGTTGARVHHNEIAYCYLGFQDNSGGGNEWFGNYVHHCTIPMAVTDGSSFDGTDITIDGNTFLVGYEIATPYGTAKSGVGIYHYYAPGAVIVAERIRNNVFVDAGETSDTEQTAIHLHDNGTPGASDYTNNAIYGYTYVLQEFPSETPAANPAGTVTADPELDANGHPQDGSPLIEAGVHTGYKVDARRTQFWNPPTIGAFEFQRARTARL